MIIQELQGDLIAAFLDITVDLDGIAHGANCFSTMGGGIAAGIAKMIPEMYGADKASTLSPKQKLGGFTEASVELGSLVATKRTGYNLYTQYHPGPDARYEAVFQAFTALDSHLKHTGVRQRIGIPLIGCGIGGLEWVGVRDVVNYVTPNIDIVVYHYQPK